MAIRFLADEDFDNDIVRGVLRRLPGLNLVRVQDAGIAGARDPAVLDFAAREGRVVLSHDANTMCKHAYSRVEKKLRMPGLLSVPQTMPIGQAIEEIVLIAECSLEGEWEGQVRYLPLR